MHYCFGDYVLDTQRRELHHAGAPIRLRRKVFQMLVYLLAHRERVVSKQELLEQLWPEQFVGDDAVTSCMKTLRQALGERGRAARFVRTLHGQGYRFVGAVEVREHDLADEDRQALHHPQGAIAPLQVDGPPPALSQLTYLTPPPWEALDGEHKQVTVLCGALAEAPVTAARLGPEAMHRLMQDVLALAQDTVQRYEGTLTQASGDGFLALFGAPLAQEDHARRAVLAALDLRQRLRVPNTIGGQPHGVAIRLGLHSGPVVVGPLAHEPKRPYIAAGDTLHVATQLQQRGAPDICLVSAATYALVQNEVQGEVYETSSLDGASPPEPAYVIHGVKQRRAGVPRRGARPLSPLVGRGEELALLHTRLEQAVGGQGQVIGIAGEPGLGKSRLLAEFAHRLCGRAVTYCDGHCLAHGQATPYLPVRDLIRQLWKLPNAAPEASVAATVQERLCEAGVTAEAEVLLLLQLLDVPADLAPLAGLDPAIRMVRTFTVLWQVIRHASRQRPLVLAVENLHWIDPTSEECLASLVERLGDSPVLLVVTYRPGYQPPWLAHSAATQIALSRLSPCDSFVVLQAVPQAAHLPTSVQEAIVAKAAGNPFFVEELTASAVEHGDYAGTLPLPDTVEAVLAARLDRLPQDAKHLVQIATVIGLEVPVPLLQRLTGLPADVLLRSLAHLQRTEFLYEKSCFPEPVYTFKHALTQDVAYNSLLHDRRRVLHRHIVEALEALAEDRVVEQVECLAHHALRGEVWDKAVLYCRQAGTKAQNRGANREAATYYEQALGALDHLPESGDTRGLGIELRRRLGGQLSLVGEQARSLAVLGEAAARARRLDDRARLGDVLCRMVSVRGIVGDFEGALAAGREAMALAAMLGDPVLHVHVSYRLGQVYMRVGDYRRAAEVLRGNVEMRARSTPGYMRDYCISSQAWLAEALGMLGEFAAGRRHGEEALRLARGDGPWYGDVPIPARARLGALYLAQGDLEAAIPVFEEGLALCRASSNQVIFGRIAGGLGEAYALTGRVAEGLALLEEARQGDLHTGAMGGIRLRQLSAVSLLAGRVDAARQDAGQALDLARQLKARGEEALALFQLGAVHAHPDPPDVLQAEVRYREALTLAKDLGMRPLQAHCHRGLGTLYAKSARPEEARAQLATALDLYRAMDMSFWRPEAEAALAAVEGKLIPSGDR